MGSTEIVFRFLMTPHRVLECMRKETKKREKKMKEKRATGCRYGIQRLLEREKEV